MGEAGEGPVTGGSNIDHKLPMEVRHKFVRNVPAPIELTPEQHQADLKGSEPAKEAKRAAKQRAKEIRSLLKRLNDQNDQGRIQRDRLLSELQSLG